MSDQALKAIAAADKIMSMSEDALAPLALSMKHWPEEFKAIVWDAVAQLASKRAEVARRS